MWCYVFSRTTSVRRGCTYTSLLARTYEPIGKDVGVQTRRIFRYWHRVHDGTLPWSELSLISEAERRYPFRAKDRPYRDRLRLRRLTCTIYR